MVVIRLTHMGRKGERRFRIVVKEKRSKRDGAAIETLGWYQKTATGETKKINKERVAYWIKQGAKPSPTIQRIIA